MAHTAAPSQASRQMGPNSFTAKILPRGGGPWDGLAPQRAADEVDLRLVPAGADMRILGDLQIMLVKSVEARPRHRRARPVGIACPGKIDPGLLHEIGHA